MLPEKRAGESAAAYAALCDYCQMGAGRSLSALLDRYRAATNTPPTRREKTLKDWSRFNEWQARSGAYDKAAAEALERELQAKRRAVMEEGLALDFERVRALKRVALLLEEELFDEKRRWAVSVKVEGKGEGEKAVTETVTTRLFNKGLITEWRGAMDDIAKEVGDRKQKTELTGKDGGPLKVDDGKGFTDAEKTERILALLNRVGARLDGPAAVTEPDLAAPDGGADGSVPE